MRPNPPHTIEGPPVGFSETIAFLAAAYGEFKYGDVEVGLGVADLLDAYIQEHKRRRLEGESDAEISLTAIRDVLARELPGLDLDTVEGLMQRTAKAILGLPE